jgi:serine/threonine-protein kinase
MSLQSHDPLLGMRFGSYVIEKLLGAGGMGAVYAAVQPEIGKRVAIKFLAPELASDAGVVQRFFAEAKSVNLIQHENIVDIFDFKVAAGYSYFVMELLPGSSLATVLGQLGRLSPQRAVAIAVQVAAAIAAAHAHNVVHRDLKPDNIFLAPKAGYEDFVKVLDFGIAKLTRADDMATPQTMRGQVMGTPGYMSPEQGTGGTVDARTDTYALGVVLFRMIAGKMPFQGRGYDEILANQLSKKAPALEGVSPELQQLVAEMLAREPGKRPQLMREVQERLVAILRTLGPTASGRLAPVSDGWRSVPPTRLSQDAMAKGRSAALAQVALRARRKRVATISAIVGMSVVGALGGWLAVRKGPRATEVTPPPAAPGVAAVEPQAPAAGEAPGFPLFLETVPPGAEVHAGNKLLGVTPIALKLPRDITLRVHHAGYRDETIEATRFVEHAILSLHPGSAPHPHGPHPPPPAPVAAPGAPMMPAAKKPPAEDGTGLGLND